MFLLLLKTDATDEELWEVLEEVCAAEFVKNQPKGLDTYLAERGGGLSEGQLQRLSIARALLCDAPAPLAPSPKLSGRAQPKPLDLSEVEAQQSAFGE